MATVYGGTVKGYWRAFLTYTLNGTYSATQASVTWSFGINWVKSVKGNANDSGNYQTEYDHSSYCSCTGQTTQYYGSNTKLTKTWYSNGNRSYTYRSGTFYINRTTANQTITLKGYVVHNAKSNTYKGSSTASVSLTIPARTAYTISFNANGGSNPPASVTKYYGYNITLPTTIPTRDYWDFNKWNTNSSGTGTNYDAGATYAGNATATLYATWSYVEPTMYSFELERMDFNSANNFSSNDEGSYLKIKFKYSSGHRPSQAASEVTTTVTAKINNNIIPVYSSGTSFVNTFTFSGENTSGITKYYNVSGTSAEQSYSIVFTLTENGHTKTISVSLPSSLYPLELAGDGQSMALGAPKVKIKKDLYCLIDESSSGDSTDIALYTAINSLGWVSKVCDDI